MIAIVDFMQKCHGFDELTTGQQRKGNLDQCLSKYSRKYSDGWGDDGVEQLKTLRTLRPMRKQTFAHIANSPSKQYTVVMYKITTDIFMMAVRRVSKPGEKVVLSTSKPRRRPNSRTRSLIIAVNSLWANIRPPIGCARAAIGDLFLFCSGGNWSARQHFMWPKHAIARCFYTKEAASQFDVSNEFDWQLQLAGNGCVCGMTLMALSTCHNSHTIDVVLVAMDRVGWSLSPHMKWAIDWQRPTTVCGILAFRYGWRHFIWSSLLTSAWRNITWTGAFNHFTLLL